MSQNKRRHIRYPIYATAAITLHDNKGQPPIMTLVNNLSQSGLGIYAYAPVRVGIAVTVDLTFINQKPPDNKDTINGKVVWISKEGDLFFVGIYFDEEISQNKHPNLHNHFSKILKQD